MKNIKNIIKRVTATIMLFVLLFGQVASVFAVEIPTPPAAPTVPTAPSAPTRPSIPSAPSAPTPPTAPTSPVSGGNNSSSQNDEEDDDQNQNNSSQTENNTNNSDSSSETSGSQNQSNNSSSSEQNQTPTQQAAAPTTSSVDNSTGSQDSDGNSGDTVLATGDATNSVVGAVVANTNLSASAPDQTTSGSAIINDGNGANSTNNGAVVTDSNTNTIQDNSANVTNTVLQDTNTGFNSASKNLGNVNLSTGDANTTGTIITSVNTNVDGLMVAEFNVEDDHVGDIILDFGSSCITNCGGSSTVANTGNGAFSSNNSDLSQTANTNTFQTNDATVLNTLTLDSNSGKNYADKNTGGDVTVTTGDANVAANALTFANNNISGNVIYGVVNIFGDLVGNIIAPEGFGLACCATDTTVKNTGNGAGSTNAADATINSNDQLFQFNNANINNNLFFDANTGDNEVSKNTDGNNSVNSGDANVMAQVLNIANNNIVGGDWWLVIVNEAGNWVGKIMGAPDGSNMAGSAGVEFVVDENGEIYASNNGNGVNSNNNSSVNQSTNNTTVQSNTADITNNLNLSANTGKNQASKNTGGDTTVTTGDATIVANLVNFVNNNIVGNGRLFVTVVNVFGSWVGDFVSPGQTASTSTNSGSNNETGRGGSTNNSQSQTSQASNNSTNNNNSTSSDDDENAIVLSSNASKTKKSGGNGTVLAFASTESNDSLSTDNITPVVESAEIKNEKKTVKVNLAWLLPLIPVLGGIIILKNKKVLLAFLAKK